MKIEAAVIKGDGVGPEMMDGAVLVLKKICRVFGHELHLHPVVACGQAIDAGLPPLPKDSLQVCQNLPAVLFGNSGLKKYQEFPLEKRPEGALMQLRRGMKVTTNLRPVKYYPQLAGFSPLKKEILEKGLDIVFVRDIAGGVLCSDQVKGQGDFGPEAYEYEYYNEKIVKDTAEIAFWLAGRRKKRVSSLDKANVLASSRLWRQCVQRTGKKHPDIGLEHLYIDNAAMKILEAPWRFDVIVTANLFGDIISDEGTQITGTPYLFASAELNQERRGIYTPNQLHYPEEGDSGKGIVNPTGMILAAALMLRYTFSLEEEARAAEQAVWQVIQEGKATRDIWQAGKRLLSTMEMAEEIAGKIGL